MKTIHHQLSILNYPLILLFLLAVGLRIGFVTGVTGFDRGTENISILNGDERDYIARAEHLLAGEGFTGGGEHDRMWRTPAYPLLLAAIFLPAGRQLWAVRALHALLGGLVCVLLFLLGARLFDRTIASLAGLYFALYPPHLYMSGLILTENLLLPGLLGMALLFLRLSESGAMRPAIGCGLLAGGCALVKPEAAGLIPIAIALSGWILREKKMAWRQCSAAVAISALAVVSPWLLRNHHLSGQWTISSLGGEALWGGNNEYVLNVPKYRGYWMAPADMPEQLKQVRAAGGEIERDRFCRRLGIEFLRAHKSDLARLAWYKFTRFYSVLVQDPRERWVLILSFGLLLPFIGAGVFIQSRRLFRDRSGGLMLIALILYYNLLALVFWGANRLRLMIDPALILFGLWAVVALVRRRDQKPSTKTHEEARRI